jgi:hypothetical protein
MGLLMTVNSDGADDFADCHRTPVRRLGSIVVISQNDVVFAWYVEAFVVIKVPRLLHDLPWGK